MVLAQPIVQKLTLEEFLQLPEAKPANEYINGTIIQKIMPQGKHSTLQFELTSAINQVGKSKKVAYAWPELRCTFCDRSLVPDIAVFTWERIPRDENGEVTNQFTLHPDWIIEILSPEQSATQVIEKIIFCLKNGSQLGWLVDPQHRSVMVFQGDRLPTIISGDDLIPVLDCLQDWRLSATKMFNWLVF